MLKVHPADVSKTWISSGSWPNGRPGEPHTVVWFSWTDYWNERTCRLDIQLTFVMVRRISSKYKTDHWAHNRAGRRMLTKPRLILTRFAFDETTYYLVDYAKYEQVLPDTEGVRILTTGPDVTKEPLACHAAHLTAMPTDFDYLASNSPEARRAMLTYQTGVDFI